jgi:hypothetical protein
MTNISDVDNQEDWYTLLSEATRWHQVAMSQKAYDDLNQEIQQWFRDADYPGYYAFGMHDWDDYINLSIQDANAAFAFKMRYGGL